MSPSIHKSSNTKRLKIIFITGERIGSHTWAPLIEEANRRGHTTVLTGDPDVNGDIGFYCDDGSVPGKQKFCVVTINGLDQDHFVRPNYYRFFAANNWGLFDLGLLPGRRWMEGWGGCSNRAAAKPRLGVLEVGWPKSDPLFQNGDPAYNRNNKVNLETVLYAPQTEQDGKQTEVVEAILSAKKKLIIKHWENRDEMDFYPNFLTNEYFENLEKENELAKRYRDVEVLDPKSNFIYALGASDLLITDQSSVMYEAALVGIPTISVRGWRHACCEGSEPSPDLIAIAEPGRLNELLIEIEKNYTYYIEKAIKLRSDNFVHLGVSSQKALDAVETFYFEKTATFKGANSKLNRWIFISKKIFFKVILEILKIKRKMKSGIRLFREFLTNCVRINS